MAIAIASADQYVFKRNYAEKRWENVDAKDRACKVQVLKKNNEFTFKVSVEGGARIERKLAKDNQLHIVNGFIQVPLSGHGMEMELYGVKFKSDADAQIFYAKIVNEIGQPWLSQMTSVEDDQLPRPVRQAPQTLQTAPGTIAQPSQHFQTMQPSVTKASGPSLVGQMNPGLGVRLPPSMQQQPSSHMQNPGKQFNQLGNPPGQFNQMGNQLDNQASQFIQPGNQPGQYNAQATAGFNQPDFPYQQQQSHHIPEQTVRVEPFQYNAGMNGGQGMNIQGVHGVNMQGAQRMNMQGGQEMNMQGAQRMNMQGVQGMNMQGVQGMNIQGGQGMNMQGVHGMNMQGAQGTNMQGVQGMNVQGAQGMNMQGGHRMSMQGGQGNPGLPGMGGAQKKKPQPQNFRKQTPPKPSEMSTVTDSLMGALNRRETDTAKHLFDVLLLAMTSPEQERLGQFRVSFDKSSRPLPKTENTFVLSVHIEFQSPRRKPTDIFLDVTADKTIMDLQYEVERRFYIPRASQNWIIGPRLVKNAEDLGKTLREFDITGIGVSGVDVCMYVMHAKKANVPKEEFEALRNRQQQTQRMQQNAAVEEQRAMQNQLVFSQGQPQQAQPQFHQGQAQRQVSYPQGNPQQYNQQQQQMSDPLYDKLGNRGYSAGQQQFQQQPLEPTYSRLDVYQQEGGQPDQLMNASPSQHAVMPQGNNDPPLRARDPGMYHTDSAQQIPAEAFQDIPNQPQNLQQQQGGGIPNGAHQQQQHQPPPPPKPKVEERKVGWSCSRCTFINRPRRPGCEQCSADRPADYVIPDECPVEDFEREALENEKLFDEYEVKEKERKEREAQENYRKLMEAEEAQLTTNKEQFECMICYTDVEPGEGVILKGCVHQFCKDCLHHTVINSEEAEIECPFDDGEYTCGAVISEREIRAVCTEEEVKAVHKRGLAQAENAAQNSFHCQTPNCEGFCFYEDDVNEFGCPVCFKANCLLCKAIHEGMNCQEYQDDIKRRAANDEAAQATQKMLEDLVRNGEAMNCPACKIIVQKKDGCDWIRCSMCKTEICWATKGPRWGPKGKGDTSGGCKCRVGGKKCTPLCRNCH